MGLDFGHWELTESWKLGSQVVEGKGAGKMRGLKKKAIFEEQVITLTYIDLTKDYKDKYFVCEYIRQ